MTVVIEPPLAAADLVLLPAQPRRRTVDGMLAHLVRFYRRPGQFRRLLVASVVLSFGGGAVMFWFHSIYRGEQGPAISPYVHWLLDSTLGFVGLTPALALLLPWAEQLSARAGGSSRPRRIALLVGPSFALVTAPGPFVHNLLVGRGTALAGLVTDLAGRDDSIAPAFAVQHRAITECLLQLLVGLPVYTVLLLMTLTAMTQVTRRRAPADTRRASSRLSAAASTSP